MKKFPRWLFVVLVILFVVSVCVFGGNALMNMSPETVPWLFLCATCLAPLAVGVGAFTLLLNFSKRTPHLEIYKNIDEYNRKHTTIELSAETRTRRSNRDEE